ncbi:uncharacterized protein LOC129948013 [Eupeodes corollae]|uniref:uncharacterized protein LOC129948013 n=1 Tax=Eupeodes corollae TaxID=290404 RepID=UPI0024924A98|nr:uncharacterized protein LOC129948013 [Eupeodes corollae]
MAATIQTQPTQQQPPSSLLSNHNNNNNKSVTNPQLKRIVYSKYRELLGSYNDKANAIIDSLPAYMVKEDRGFHFDPQIINDCDNVVYGTPPAPPPLSAGSIPSQRLSTQIPQYNVAEAPACVQNAMMTKDKKPFTYTPGGIDLSQIKSQRMAKRLARNAQSEGATGQQQLHRPTQMQSPSQQQSNGGTVAASQLGATAMGMPFQVLPTGPPPPPPQPIGKVGAPPPPPPAPQNKLAPQSNGNAQRRSPTPQNFEPPPMGFRPEIKIPPNPMASLKKVPPPQEKNNFWVEEYRKERSKSPMVGNDENDNNRSSPNNPKPETNQYSYTNNNSNQQNDYQQNQYRAPQSPQPMRQQQQQEFYNQRQPSPPRTPIQHLDEQRRNESPYQPSYSPQQQQSPSIQRQNSQYQQQNSPQQQQSPTIQRQSSQLYQNSPQQSPLVQRQQSIPTAPQQYHQSSPQQSPSIQRQQTVPQPQYQQSPTSPHYQQQQQQQQSQQQASPTPQQSSVPWRQQKQVPLGIQNNVSRPRDVISPGPIDSPRPQQQPQQQYPAYLRSREAQSPAPEQKSPQMSQPYQQKNAQVGSIYIPPVANQQQQQQQYSPYQDSQGPRQQQQAPRQAPTNRWMNAQGQTVESLNHVKSPPPTSSPSISSSNGFGNTGLRLQINNNTTSSNVKERIIPIQLEKTPTPTRTPSSAPGFGPQPFYNSAQQQQYSSVPSPPMTQGSPNNGQNSPNYVVRSPNQFVDQGYNQYSGVQDHPSRVTSPPVQQSSRIIQQTSTAGGVMTRIIPIALESQPDGPLNPNNARGPISQQPIVIQNDPRNQNTWGSGSATPTQSKSFRILQKITDTSDDSALENKAIESDGGGNNSGSDYQEPQLQRPTFARQMTSTGQINSPNAEQMKRMQLQNEQGYVNRARNQDEDKKSTSDEDPRYRGPSNPSKTFKKLQGAVERCSPSGKTDENGTPPVMKQPQPNRYVSQRPVYSPDEHSQQYVHPSEQHVPEPKIYTGSAIPSRSFKILQAMTTPENADRFQPKDNICGFQNEKRIRTIYLKKEEDIKHGQMSNIKRMSFIFFFSSALCSYFSFYYYFIFFFVAESDSSDVVETDTSISECPYQQQQPQPSYPYPYPYLPPCCAHPSPPPHPPQQPSTSSSGGDLNNWQYPLPYHPHPHHHPHHHHHHHHPYPPPPHHPHSHHPHQHPAYPYPPPCPCYFYNFHSNDYDSQNCSSRSSFSSRGSYSRGRSQSQDLPNIIITPSTDDVPQEINGESERMARNQREGSVIDILSQRLSEISKPNGKDLNISQEDEKKFNGDNGKEFSNSPSPIKSESENSKISSEDSSEELLTSCSEPSSSSSSEECVEGLSNDGLQAIKSVTNIQFYNKKMMDEVEDDDRTIAGDESMVFDEEEEEEEEIIGEELEYDEEEVLVEEMDSEAEEEDEEEIFEQDEIIIMDDLSVIYEENEEDHISPRPSSHISSSVSESSTLANEECEEEELVEEEDADKKENDEEDNSNSVTVRLPLRFSFSRSSNDENIATVEVGNSQIEDKGRSFSIASVEAEPESYETDSQDCDVSVTISLSRSSESVDKKVSSPSPLTFSAGEVIQKEVKTENIWESEDEDVSVSFSLPMRNKFMDQTWSGDLTNNISMIEEKNNREDANNDIKDKTSVEAWRRNNILFEENEEKKRLLEENNSLVVMNNKTNVENPRAETYVCEEKQTILEEVSACEAYIETTEETKEEYCSVETSVKSFVEDEEEAEEKTDSKSEEELDFWETLQATRKEAQLFLEKTAGYWGKSVDGKEKAEPGQIETPKPQDIEEKDEDFWSNIRIKKEPEEKKDSKPKTPKLKKKKKVVKAPVKEPLPDPEPEPKLTIIKLPNANNKSKVVESAIQMIQEKTKKPKKLVKQVSKEEVKVVKAAMENEIVQISKAVEEEKKLIEEAKIRRASLVSAKSIDEFKIKEEAVPKKEEEENDNNSKYVREKAELKTQILNQKFAKAFVIPNKPPLMNAVLTEAECEAPTLNHNQKSVTNKISLDGVKSEESISKTVAKETSISNDDTKIAERKNSIPKLLVSHDSESSTTKPDVIEEPKKLIKKKIIKAKTTNEESDGNTLKPPVKKTLKKATKETKKIKKKKEDTSGVGIKIEEVKEIENTKVVSEEISQEVFKSKTQVVHVEEKVKEIVEVKKTSSSLMIGAKSDDTDFWAEIENSKSNDNLCKKKEDEAESTNIETDPWANIQTSKEASEESSKIVTQEHDVWAEIESVTGKNLAKPNSLDEEPDFWAEIDSVKTKKEQDTESHILVESSKLKTQQKVLAENVQTLEWFNIEMFKAQEVKSTEVYTPIVLNGCKDFWAEKIEKPSTFKKAESQENDFWLEIESTKVKNKDTKECSRKQTSKTNIDVSSVSKLKTMPTEDNLSLERNSKKKVKKSYSSCNVEKETEVNKPKTKKKSSDGESSHKYRTEEENCVSIENSNDASKPKSKRKISTTNEELINQNTEADLKIKTKKKSKSHEMNDGEKLSSLKTKSKKKSISNQEEDTTMWLASNTSKSTKSCSLQVYSDYDIELIHSDPEPIFYPIHSEPETGISFWATVSYVPEEEPQIVEEQEIDFWASNQNESTNSEIDTGKIDFWVTQRKFEFEANRGFIEEPKPAMIEEPTEEVDFWAEIKGPNEDVNEEPPSNDDCELRRNNYKKAMAFFTNTVNVEKKEEPKKIIALPEEEGPTWSWRNSVEPEWDVPEQQVSNNVVLVLEDNETTEDEPETLIENKPYDYGNTYSHEQQRNDEEESQSSESISDSTPNHFQIEHLYPKPEPEQFKPKEDPIEPIQNEATEESKISVKDRIFAFESGTTEPPPSAKAAKTSLIVDSTSPKSNLSRNSSQRSESEIEEDDSGVTDMNKPLSETDTESESFPELRKMSRYQRASTHSRLFKLLQDDGDVIEEEQPGDEEAALEAEFNFKPRKKIVHNVSITRKQNPKALQEAETVTERRQRLSLPLRKNQSIDADNPSSPNSPASPIHGQQSQPISDKLVNELIQSLLLKKSSSSLKNLPMEKLQAAAKRVLEEELDSLENTSLDSTPALTPQEFKNESYADYYDTWSSSKMDSDNAATNGSFEILPSKAFKVLQETAGSAKRKPWAVRCPRVLSSKTVNRDLARVTESPEIVSRSSRSPEMFSSERAGSVGRWKKV